MNKTQMDDNPFIKFENLYVIPTFHLLTKIEFAQVKCHY